MDREELIRLAGEKLADAIFRDAPTAMPGLQARPVGQVHGDEVRVFFYGDVLDELIFAAAYRPEASVAVLMGAFAVDDRAPFIEITGFSDFQQIADLEELYAVLKPAMDTLLSDLSRAQEPREHIVGLFVSAPGSGGRLLPEVARAHLSLFNVPYQVAAVLDPDAGQFGLHARPPASTFYNSPFWVVRNA